MEQNSRKSQHLDAHKLLEELSEEVKCAICLELFDDPRLLSCSHTFCYDCISQLVQRGKILCPICRTVHKLDRSGVSGLPKNRYIHNIVEKLRASERPPSPILPQSPIMSAPSDALPFPYNLYSSTAAPSAPVYPSTNQYIPNPTNNDYPYYTTSTTTSTSPSIYSNVPAPMSPTLPHSPEFAPSAPPVDFPIEHQQHTQNNVNNNHNQYPGATSTTTTTTTNNANSTKTAPTNPPTSNVSNKNNNNNNNNNGPVITPGTTSMTYKEETIGTSIINGIMSLFTSWGSNDKGTITSNNSEGANHVFFAPFAVKSSELRGIFDGWVSSLWFAPTDFRDYLKIVRMESIYIPFWVYDITAQSNYEGDVCHYQQTASGSKKRSESWTRASGSLTANYFGVLVCADIDRSENFVNYIRSIDDWHTAKAKHPSPLSCSDSKNPTLSLITRVDRHMTKDQAFPKAAVSIGNRIEEEAKAKLKRENNAENVNDFRQQLSYPQINCALLHLPVYVIIYSYENREYELIINAQTGTIKGQRPYGLGRIGSLGKSGIDLLGGIVFGKKAP